MDFNRALKRMSETTLVWKCLEINSIDYLHRKGERNNRKYTLARTLPVSEKGGWQRQRLKNSSVASVTRRAAQHLEIP